MIMHSISCEILNDSEVLRFCVATGAGPPELSRVVPAALPAHLHLLLPERKETDRLEGEEGGVSLGVCPGWGRPPPRI